MTSYEFFQVRAICIAVEKVTSDKICLAMAICTLQEMGASVEFFWEKVTLVEQGKMMPLGQGTLVHAFRKYVMLEESVQNRVTYVPEEEMILKQYYQERLLGAWQRKATLEELFQETMNIVSCQNLTAMGFLQERETCVSQEKVTSVKFFQQNQYAGQQKIPPALPREKTISPREMETVSQEEIQTWISEAEM